MKGRTGREGARRGGSKDKDGGKGKNEGNGER